jgi:hypothetical protein
LSSPTAAFLLLESTINAATKTILSPHTMIFAILPRLPFTPAFRIPQSGFTPTGAEAGSADVPVKEVEEASRI